MFVSWVGDWRRGLEYAWLESDPEPNEGPSLSASPLTALRRLTHSSIATYLTVAVTY
jgi:hypothetical protein